MNPSPGIVIPSRALMFQCRVFCTELCAICNGDSESLAGPAHLVTDRCGLSSLSDIIWPPPQELQSVSLTYVRQGCCCGCDNEQSFAKSLKEDLWTKPLILYWRK